MTQEENVEPGIEANEHLQSALRLAKSLKSAVQRSEGDLEGHSFEEGDVLGERPVSLNAGCACA